MSDITEESIRERLAIDKAKPSRLATWAEIEFLLGLVDDLRAESIYAPAAMYGQPGREPICDFDAEVKRLQNALLWIRYQAALHHLGGAFEPVHMLAIANTAGDALSGRDDMPDFNTVIEAAQEKATEWAEKYAALAEK